jgi:hypothetical protein
MRDRPAGGAVGGVDVGDTGWIGSAPGPVVTGIGPELTGLGAPAPGIEHGRCGLVGKQLARALQRLQQSLVHRPEQESGAPDPVGERRTIEDDALTGEDLRLAIERQVVGVFGAAHLRDQRVGGQAALDQPGRCRGLYERVLAGPAGVARAADHQYPELRRHHVEPLGHVLANLVQGTRAARAGGAVDVDEGLDPRQMSWERPAVGATFADPDRLLGRLGLLGGKTRGLDLLGLFQPEQELVLGQALGPASEAVALHRQDDLAQPLVLGLRFDELRLERLGIVR